VTARKKLKFHTDPKALIQEQEIEEEKKEKILDEWMNRAGGGDREVIEKTVEKRIEDSKEKRINQHKKIFYLSTPLESAWLDYQNDYRKKTGKKLTWQSFIESYLKRSLKDYL